MRIAQVVHVKDGLAAGIERHVFNLAIAQQERGDSPIVVVPEPGGLTAACDECGIPVAIEPHLSGRPAPAIDYLCSRFTNLGVEVIHYHTPNVGLKEVVAASNKIGIPCVYTHHVDAVFKIPDLEFAVITVGRMNFERLKKNGFPEERLYYVPDGTKAAPRLTNGLPRPSLIAVGRLEFVKGFDIAILAMAELKRRHGLSCPPLNIYGAGPMAGYLKEIVSVLCLDDTVRFHGVQLGILERCPATDILIVSSRAEAGPLTALEAMSRGLPIVSTRVGGIEEMLPDQRYGYIVQTESIIALADGIESMLSDVRAGRFDPDLPISRHRGLYSVEKMAERVDAVYKRLTIRNAPVG
jgi:glycosyltransferase involved in cell wall biosynthesis